MNLGGEGGDARTLADIGEHHPRRRLPRHKTCDFEMKRNDPTRGTIINISSIEGLVDDLNLGAYNASKGGERLYIENQIG